MDIYVFILIAIIFGIGIVIFSIIKFKPEENSSTDDLDRTVEKLAASINDADNAIEEINKLSKSVLDEISIKYQELLHLYSIIDEKEKSLSSTYKQVDVSIQDTFTPNKPARAKSPPDISSINNPKHREIIALSNSGMNVSEIAKRLNLGQGEVSLVLELGKDR